MAYAHTRNHAGNRHDLTSHLLAVANLAHAFAAKFGAGDLAYLAGMWHDLGKFHPDFQAYLHSCEREPERKHKSVDHKRAGTTLARECAPQLAFVIRGHHGGIPAGSDLTAWVKDASHQAAIQTALGLARQALGGRLDEFPRPYIPDWANELAGSEFFIRMLFSALVDADFLDTERHFNPGRSEARTGVPDLVRLWERFETDQQRLLNSLEGAANSPVNGVRREVYDACLTAATESPGFFRLTVPTGGGKTRSGLGFALKHALTHGLDRVIIAIPYTSIIDQTARVFRDIFQASDDDLEGERTVLEHHSAMTLADEQDGAPVTAELAWSRLASENWDAPVVITTTVQFFESLLGARTTACRKLHNIARSVIVLDEVQTLPPHLLEPTLEVLRELVGHYGASVVLCTATQPALDESPDFRGLPGVREIVRNANRHFSSLRRVEYSWASMDGTWSWARVANEMRRDPIAMAIVNTKGDALALLAELDDATALHLSTLLCGAHRQAVLREVERRLAANEPCRLVATQVVEAGVDIDFPLVLRALGPLDRVAQAAGRCNREGRLPGLGRVVVFAPNEHHQPPGAYQIGTATTEVLLRATNGALDLNDPGVFTRYFKQFYSHVDLDRGKIQALRRQFDYPEVDRRYRLIEDEGVSVVVSYQPHAAKIDRLLQELTRRPERSRGLLRRLQPYLVSIRQGSLKGYAARGLATELLPGLWVWRGKYDTIRGIGAGEIDVRELVV